MKFIFLTYTLSVLCACSMAQPLKDGSVQTIKLDVSASVIHCKDPRPKMCTREYKPVCASKDTGVRCITSPCPSTESVTYSTGCTACADPAVYSYEPGACNK